jgi:RNA polymerase sigma-70 factor (ECF subfamily)
LISITQCLDIRNAGPAEIIAGLASMAYARSPEMADVKDKTDTNVVDLEDIRLTLDGDDEAYRRLVERHQGQISSMMWRFSRDLENHEELVQDVFVEAYLSLSGYHARAPFSHWLARIATRVGYRYWKRRARERKYPMVSLQEWDQLPDSSPEDLEPSRAAELLHTLLEQLPPRDRLVLTLRYVEDYSVEETARLTGWSTTMVKVQSWRARKKMKKLFEQAGVTKYE